MMGCVVYDSGRKVVAYQVHSRERRFMGLEHVKYRVHRFYTTAHRVHRALSYKGGRDSPSCSVWM